MKTPLAYGLGIVIGVGIALMAYQLDYWWTGTGLLNSLPFLGLGLLSGVIFLIGRLRQGEWVPAVTSMLATATVLMLILGWQAGYLDTVEAAYGAAMRADLRNLVAAQDQVFADSQHFTGSAPYAFQLSTGNVDLAIRPTPDGWTASLHSEHTPRACAVFVGSVPIQPAVREREPACTRVPFAYSEFAIMLLGTVAVAIVAWITSPGTRLVRAA